MRSRHRSRRGKSAAGWVTVGLGAALLATVALSDEQPFDLFPMSKPWRDVRIPRYDEKDVLTSMMHTEALTRQNEKELKLDGLTLVMFQSNGEKSLRLKTKEGLYDVASSMLRTHSTTYIEHAQFEMKGNRMRFDTAKQQGTLEGNVEMLIFGVPMPAPGPVVPSQVEPAAPEPVKPAAGEDNFRTEPDKARQEPDKARPEPEKAEATLELAAAPDSARSMTQTR